MTASQIAKTLHGKKSGKRWMCRCPTHLHAHGDRNRSLSVWESEDGWVRLKCFTGCTRDEILAAMGLKVRDLALNEWKPQPWSPPKPDWIEKEGPVWFETCDEAMSRALACVTLLAVPEHQRGGWEPIWNKINGPIPDPDALVSGRWNPRPPDGYFCHPVMRNSFLESEIRRAIISWYRIRANERRNGETQRIIREYGFDELWECLPARVAAGRRG